jgi:hypothetical protein
LNLIYVYFVNTYLRLFCQYVFTFIANNLFNGNYFVITYLRFNRYKVGSQEKEDMMKCCPKYLPSGETDPGCGPWKPSDQQPYSCVGTPCAGGKMIAGVVRGKLNLQINNRTRARAPRAPAVRALACE